MSSRFLVFLLASTIVIEVQAPSAQAAAPAASPTSSVGGPPAARTTDTVDSLFGAKVRDPYRWMEGDTNSERAAWLRAQGDYTSGYLARLPGRTALLSRLRELGLGYGRPSGVQLAGGRVFH